MAWRTLLSMPPYERDRDIRGLFVNFLNALATVRHRRKSSPNSGCGLGSRTHWFGPSNLCEDKATLSRLALNIKLRGKILCNRLTRLGISTTGRGSFATSGRGGHLFAGRQRAGGISLGGADLGRVHVHRVVTGRQVAVRVAGQRRLHLAADLGGPRAPGVEDAARRRIDRVGRLAGDDDPLAPAVLLGVRDRDRRQQRRRVGMDRLGVELLCGL